MGRRKISTGRRENGRGKGERRVAFTLTLSLVMTQKLESEKERG